MQQMLFSDPIKLNATRYAEKEAISFRDKIFTYHELNTRINQLGHALQGLGIQKGDKVAFMLLNCNELFEIMFACGKIGAVFVPINSRFVGPEIQYVLENSDATAFIFGSEFESEVKTIQGEVKGVRHFISVGQAVDIAPLEYEKWLADYSVTEPEPA